MAAEQAPTAYRTVVANGIRLHVAMNGDGGNTVFLHGFGGDLHSWDSLWPFLANGSPAIRYDLRGFGKSCVAEPTEFSHCDDLLALADELELSTMNLVGLSMGGAIALHAALNKPERVKKLVLISPGMMAWQWTQEWIDLWRPMVAAARADNMSSARELWWQHPLFKSTRRGRSGALLKQSIANYSGREWIKDYQRPVLPDIDRISALQVPTLLLTGGEDLDDFKLIADVIENTASCVDRVNYANQGHLLTLEIPEQIAHQINHFLK